MKLSKVALLALVLPMGLAAQTPAGPPANPITAAFAGRIRGLHRSLSQAFDSIPESKFSYKPTPAQLTIGFIAQHLASDSYLFCTRFGPLPPTMAAEDTTTADSVKATWAKEKLVTKLKASFAYCDQALGQLDDAKLADQVQLTVGGNTRNVGRANMVLGHAMDLADHYSQIANYMRLNGLIPPTALPRPGRSGGGGNRD
jgi:hypothetical protein